MSLQVLSNMQPQIIETEKKLCKICESAVGIPDWVPSKGMCVNCNRRLAREYLNTKLGRLRLMLKEARVRSIARTSSGKSSAGMFNIALADLLSLWDVQGGRCDYSGLEMSTDNSQHWLVSLERKDTHLGYVADNIVLCAAEFNGQVQWNIQKIMQLANLRKQPVDVEAIKLQIVEALGPKRQNNGGNSTQITRHIEIKDNVKFLDCTKCKAIRPVEEFPTSKYGCGFRSRCKECVATEKKHVYYSKSHKSHFSAYCAGLLGASKQRLKHRNRKRKRIEFERNIEIGTLKVGDIYDMIIKQNRRCAYSDVPLVFAHNSDWRCSLERLNNDKGYTVANCVLVCLEFNTAKQWSKAKFEQAFSSIQSKLQQSTSSLSLTPFTLVQ